MLRTRAERPDDTDDGESAEIPTWDELPTSCKPKPTATPTNTQQPHRPQLHGARRRRAGAEGGTQRFYLTFPRSPAGDEQLVPTEAPTKATLQCTVRATETGPWCGVAFDGSYGPACAEPKIQEPSLLLRGQPASTQAGQQPTAHRSKASLASFVFFFFLRRTPPRPPLCAEALVVILAGAEP